MAVKTKEGVGDFGVLKVGKIAGTIFQVIAPGRLTFLMTLSSATVYQTQLLVAENLDAFSMRHFSATVYKRQCLEVQNFAEFLVILSSATVYQT